MNTVSTMRPTGHVNPVINVRPESAGDRSRKGARTVWSERLRARIPELYDRGDLTVDEIAKTQNVTRQTVVKYLSETTRGDRTLHDVLALHGRGVTRLAIADAVGIGDRRVGQLLARSA
jgi:hypothetical protein